MLCYKKAQRLRIREVINFLFMFSYTLFHLLVDVTWRDRNRACLLKQFGFMSPTGTLPGFFVWGASFRQKFEPTFLEAFFSPAEGSFYWWNIEIKLANHISPSPKGLMGFILFGGLFILFGGLKPPQAHAWIRPWWPTRQCIHNITHTHTHKHTHVSIHTIDKIKAARFHH